MPQSMRANSLSPTPRDEVGELSLEAKSWGLLQRDTDDFWGPDHNIGQLLPVN